MRAAALVCATLLAAPLLASAAPNAASGAAAEVAPPRCDDPRVLSNIQRSYLDVSLNVPLPPLQRIEPPREVALLARVAALDTPGNRILFHGEYPWGHSRFCVARLHLGGGGTDTAYWRIDARKGGPEDQYQLTPCFDAWMRKMVPSAPDCNIAKP